MTAVTVAPPIRIVRGRDFAAGARAMVAIVAGLAAALTVKEGSR
jgi:hypothetical protein